jgi:cyanophycinase
VIGSGGIYVIDGKNVSHCNLAEAEPDRVLSLHGMTVHVLGTGDRFDLSSRTPLPAES